MKPLTVTRVEGGVMLGSRAALQAFARRDHMTIRRNCEPIACDTLTRALLYDLIDSTRRLAERRRVA